MHGGAVNVKDGLPFLRDLSLENSADYYLCFWLALLHSVFYFFFIHQSPSTPLLTVFDAITSYIDEVLLINPPANAFAFGYFNWPTYSARTTRSGELCYKFFISTYLTQMVNFSTQITDCGSCSPALLDLFIFSELVFILQWLYLH